MYSWFIKAFSDDYRYRLQALVPEFPSVVFDYGETPKYNTSKVALLIENRQKGVLAPLIVSMMAALPQDWTFRFMGSPESVAKVNSSAAIRRNVNMERLSLTYIPSNMTTSGQEEISTFLTNLWVNEVLLRPAEWLLVYQLDSECQRARESLGADKTGLICSKASSSLNEWLEYDWVGAPWNTDSRYGGNGGLSLRRVSSMLEVIKHQQRISNSEPEDVWLTDRLGCLPDAHTANGTESNKFSVESIWHDEPMGYHIGGSGAWLTPSIWGTEDHRQHIWDYCPEMKVIMDLDLKNEIKKSCEMQ